MYKHGIQGGKRVGEQYNKRNDGHPGGVLRWFVFLADVAFYNIPERERNEQESLWPTRQVFVILRGGGFIQRKGQETKTHDGEVRH